MYGRTNSVNSDIRIALENPTNIEASAGNEQITISWTDPNDISLGQTVVAEWKGTRVVRKAGSEPTDINDGTLVEDSQVKNQYSSVGYTDTGLTNGTTYYYKLFAYTTKGIVSDGATVSATPMAAGLAISITNAGANASVTATDGTDTYTATADASGNANVVVSASGTYTITANGTGENKRYATEVVVEDSAVSVKMLNVPKEWKEVACIISHGTEYIDTGYSAPHGFVVKIDFSATDTSQGGTLPLIMARNASASREVNYFSILKQNNYNQFSIDGSVSGAMKSDLNTWIAGQRYVLEASNIHNNFYLKNNGTTIPLIDADIVDTMIRRHLICFYLRLIWQEQLQ